MLTTGIIIGVTSIVLMVLGWLITQIYELNRQIIKLSDSITGLNGIILSQTEKFTGNEKACDLRHAGIREKLENHECRITEHGREIDHIKIQLAK